MAALALAELYRLFRVNEANELVGCGCSRSKCTWSNLYCR